MVPSFLLRLAENTSISSGMVFSLLFLVVSCLRVANLFEVLLCFIFSCTAAVTALEALWV